MLFGEQNVQDKCSRSELEAMVMLNTHSNATKYQGSLSFPKPFVVLLSILCFAFLFCSALYDWRAGEMLGGYETTASLVLIGLAFSVAAYVGNTVKLSVIVLIGGFLIGTLNVFLVNAAKQADRNQFVLTEQKASIARAKVQVELWEARAKQAMEHSKYINPKIQENLTTANARLDKEIETYRDLIGPLGEVATADHGYKVIAQFFRGLNYPVTVLTVSFIIEGFRSILFIVSLIFLMQVLRQTQLSEKASKIKEAKADKSLEKSAAKNNVALPPSLEQEQTNGLALEDLSSKSLNTIKLQAGGTVPAIVNLHHDQETEATPWDNVVNFDGTQDGQAIPDSSSYECGDLVELTDDDEENYQIWLRHIRDGLLSASQEDSLRVFGLRYSKWRWFSDRAQAEGVLIKGPQGLKLKESMVG